MTDIQLQGTVARTPLFMFTEVKIYFVGTSCGQPPDQQYMVLNADVMNFIKGLVKLHVRPGINPYSKAKTTPIDRIRTCEMSRCSLQKFWWASPSLDDKDMANMLFVTGKQRSWQFRAYHEKCGTCAEA